MVGITPTVPEGFCWVNGHLVMPGEAAVSAIDHAVIVGDGVFETLKVVNNIPFALTRHLARLQTSAEGMGLPPPDETVVRDAVAQTLSADPMAGLLRVTWSSGPGPLGSNRGDGPGTLMVATSQGKAWSKTERVHLCEWTRNERGALTGLKTTSYGENVRALGAARERGSGEALMANTAGMLCEGTGTNVFVVVNGILATPPLSSGCLAGITRDLIIELVDVVERDVEIAELAEASEMFLTSSTREIQPVSEIDEITLPAAPGAVTTSTADRFASLVATNPDP